MVDGSGRPPVRADVAVAQGRIARVGNLAGASARRVLDVSGLAVAPGFLDLLCHNDLLWDRKEQERAVRRGATFGLVGNCGFSVLYVDSNLRKVEDRGCLLHVGTLVGHGTLRSTVMGEAKRAPTAVERERMRAYLERGLAEGAFGLSSGLGYSQGEWSEPEELQELAKVLGAHPHAAYYTHLRNFRSEVLSAIDEALDVGRTAGIPVVIQHLLFKMPGNWGKAAEGLRRIEKARARGQAAFATVYPYDFWGNEVQLPLHQFLYLTEKQAAPSRWSSPEDFEEVRAEARRRLVEYGGAEGVELTVLPRQAPREWLGRSLAEVAEARSLDPVEAVLALLWEGRGKAAICYRGLSEEVLVRQMRAPFVLFGSDAAGTIPHPRNVGSFPRLLGTYVREKRVLRLEEAVARLTREPARLLGLSDRGAVEEGFRADLVVFDPRRIRDRATPVSPWEPPEGVVHVLVDGVPVLEGGELTGAAPGKALRRGREG